MASSFSAFVYNTLKAPSIDGVTGAIDLNTGKAVASASTINLDTATGNRVHITGTTAITAVTLTRGPRTVIFDGILTLTHNATTNNLPGAANITTAAGDRAIYESDGTTVYCVSYIKVSGAAVVGTGGFTLGTPVNVSGTSVTFTGIPAGTKQIVMTFNGVSNTDEWLIQLGDSGGIETSNYVTVSAQLQSGSTVQTTSSLIGFIVKTNNELVFSGTMTWTLLNSATFLWAGSGGLGSDTATGNMNITSSGKKALSAELTQIRLTTVNGTDSFSAGSINIAYI